jgi:hypothetical protein
MEKYIENETNIHLEKIYIRKKKYENRNRNK